MNKKNIDLEKKLTYRLIQAMYAVLLVLIVFISVMIGLDAKPEIVPNQYKSYINCKNGDQISFKEALLSRFDVANEESLNTYGDEKARILCANYNRQKALDLGLSNYVIDDYIKNNLIDKKNYRLTMHYTIEGSWTMVLTYIITSFLFGYISLNIFKETILYVIFGKKVSWKWILPL
jgi:hypothetical protein